MYVRPPLILILFEWALTMHKQQNLSVEIN